MRKHISSIEGDYSRAIEPPPYRPTLLGELRRGWHEYCQTKTAGYLNGAILGVILFLVLGWTGCLDLI